MSEFIDAVTHASQLLGTLIEPTPLQYNAHLSKQYDASIYLKREDLSPVRSYKIRGALNSMSKVLAKDGKDVKFVCASAGNHAQGVAYACKYFDVEGVIYMPITTPQQKIEKTKTFGGENIRIELFGDYFDDTLEAAQQYCKKENGVFLPPYDSLDVIEGQATIGLEITSELGKAPDIVVLPVGGGGLSAGMVRYFDEMNMPVELFLVEPEGGASLGASLKAGKLVTLDHVNNFVDGAAVARIGVHNFDVLKNQARDHVLAIPESRLCQTMVEMLNIEGIVLEPAGALAVDALQDIRDQIKGKTVVVILSGGNFDFERLPDVKERAMRYSGLKKYLILQFPQRPGALRDFLHLLGPDDDIARFEYLKKSARNYGSVLIGIESKKSTSFPALFERLEQEGFSFQDITEDDVLSQFLI